MTQTSNRIFDEMAKLMTDVAGAAHGMRQEVETIMRSQAERILREMDVVQREEFEAMKTLAIKAHEENANLAKRLTELEAKLEGKEENTQL
ncbi:MAG: accessory factor UbiK family protein [Pseudomonadota bacterium]